ncbi:hypothetical protein ACFO3D_14565 [Virgibacillus kekensis]|uniref:Uncharacterized protein n=1 Tax=Virgibacillus kekensis TaxID=202261 RepID=A0ABV9DMV0_9BACI
MQFDDMLENLLNEATMYFLFAKRYEYVDPQRHMYFYQKHFDAAMRLEQHYMMLMGEEHGSHKGMHGHFSMY